MPEEIDPLVPDGVIVKLLTQLRDLDETVWVGVRLGLTKSQAAIIATKAAKIASVLEKRLKEE